MKKIKLTREQAEAIEKAISEYGIDTTMHDHSPNNWGGLLAPLNELKPHQMARALYIGYEVEETFKVGDWVVTEDGMVAEIIDVCMFHNDSVALYGVDGRHTFDTLRHATPEEIAEEKQRRWWAKYGRGVYEFKTGDLIKCDDTISEVEVPEEDLIWIKMNGAKGTLPEKLYQGIKVICFAEDRKDLEA